MRLSFLSAFPPYRGGIAQFSTALVRALRRSHAVSAFTFTRQYPGFLFPGSTQYDRSIPDEVQAERVLDSIGPWTWPRTARRMAATGPDVAVLRFWMPFFGPALGAVAARLRKRGVKVLAIVDNAVPHEPRFFDRAFTRYFLRRCDGFIALSEAVRNDLLRLRPDAAVRLLPHPLYDHFGTPLPATEARQRLGLPADARVLLFFGLIRDYKGLDLLIEAFSRLAPRYHLVIAGEPYGDFASYQQAIDASPLRANIHVHARYIADSEVPLFFSAADATVLPYKSATQSGITAIAYHFGVPIIATDTGGLKEAVHHGRTGLIVREVSAEAIADAIRAFFEQHDPQVFRRNIAALRQELSWERFAKELSTFAQGLQGPAR